MRCLSITLRIRGIAISSRLCWRPDPSLIHFGRLLPHSQEGLVDDEGRSRLKEFLLAGDEAALGILAAYQVSGDEVRLHTQSHFYHLRSHFAYSHSSPLTSPQSDMHDSLVKLSKRTLSAKAIP